MLKEYLSCAGKTSELSELDRLCEMLQGSSTKEEFDEVGSLLSDFAGLQIQQESNREPR